MQLGFIHGELLEARMLRYMASAEGRSADQLAGLMFACLLAVEMLRRTDPSSARSYAKNTVMVGEFDRMKSSASDLHNIMVILDNQAEFEGVIRTDYRVSPALLETKAYLRRVMTVPQTTVQDRFVLSNVAQHLQISHSGLLLARRVVSYWEDHSTSEQRNAHDMIERYIRSVGPGLDILSEIR